MAGSVGSAAASGIESGFQMGREIDQDADRKAQQTRNNARQDRFDAEAEQDRTRNQSNADQDRQLAALNAEMEDNRFKGAGLAQKYGGADKIPPSEAQAYIAQANDVAQRRQQILNSRFKPTVDADQAWAQNTASRIQTGQMSMDDLSPADAVRLIQINTRRPVTDFIRPANGGNSIIGQAINDTKAGIQTNNGYLTTQGAGVLLKPDLDLGTGQIAPDGSTIVSKQLHALVPAPQATPAPAGPPPITGLATALSAATGAATGAPPAAAPVPNTPDASSSPVTPNGPPAAGAAPPGATPAAPPPPPGPMGVAPATPPGDQSGQQQSIRELDPNATDPAPTPAPGAGAAPPPAAAAAPGAAGILGAPTGAAPPPPVQPGTDSGSIIPVLQVTAQHPDGTEVTYHAPVTQNRSTDPNDPIAPGFQMSDAMDHMGRLGTLEAWANTPAARAKIQQGLAELGANAGDFLGAYAAMHGDPSALQPGAGGKDATSMKIAAIQRFAVANNIPFEEARKQIFGAGTGGAIEEQIATVHRYAVAHGLTDDDAAKALQQQGIIKSPPHAGDTPLDDAAVDQLAAAALKDRSVLTGFGRDPNKMTAIVNRMAQLSPGGDVATNRAQFAADQTSYKKLVPMYDAVTAFENNTLAQGKVLVGLADKVDTTGVPVIERWIRGGRQNIEGDPDVSRFNAQLQLFGNEAAKILSNPNLTGVLSDSARKEVESFLPSTASPAQIRGVVSLLENDFNIRKKSLEDQSAAITARMSGQSPSAAAGLSGGGGLVPRGAAPAATGITGGGASTRVPPATQASRDSDAGQILRQELTAAQGRLASGDPRAQDDVAALQREISALPATKIPQPARSAAPAPAAAPAGRIPPSQGVRPAAAVQTATNPTTGERLQLVNGAWVPLK